MIGDVHHGGGLACCSAALQPLDRARQKLVGVGNGIVVGIDDLFGLAFVECIGRAFIGKRFGLGVGSAVIGRTMAAHLVQHHNGRPARPLAL